MKNPKKSDMIIKDGIGWAVDFPTICQCGHKENEHDENGYCLKCDCKEFKWKEK